MSDLSTRQLRAFLALAQERHFTRAAQRCHLTQPAFSAVIRGLESTLGTRLFDRSTRSVELTPSGVVFAGSAQRLLGEFALVQSDLGDFLAQRHGRVTIAALPSLAAGWLPSVLARFHASYPGIRMVVLDTLAERCVDAVLRGEADMALAALADDMSGLDSQFLHADRFYVVCPAAHPLATVERVRTADLARWPLVHMARHSSVRRRLDQLLPASQRQGDFEVEHLATATGLVQAGFGIAVMPAMTLFHFRRPGLVIRPIAGRALTRSLYLITRRGRSLSPASAALAEQVIAWRDEIAQAELAMQQ